jgi:hypothetical protein
MSSTYLDLKLRADAREIFTAGEAPSARNESERTLRGGQAPAGQTLGPDSTPAIEGPPISRQITLAGSTVTIDLTAAAVLALPGSASRTHDFSAKKVVCVVLRADGDNADPITVAPGVSNPYAIFGASKDIDIAPGMTVAAFFADVPSSLPAVAGGAKEIDISGTTADILYVDLYLGT